MNDQASEPKRRGRPPKGNEDGVAAVKALERGLRLLEVLEETGGLPQSELARRAELPVSSTYRLLATLQAHGFVRFDEPRNCWRVGVRAFEIGQTFAREIDLVEISRPPMDRLMQASQETVSLGRLEEDEIIFIAQVESRASIRAFFPPGERGPLHASGCGKAVLSTWPASRIARVMREKGMKRYTDRTIAEIGPLLADLDVARARGWSINDEEHTPGMRCVAAPIFDASDQAMAAISISGPTSRVSDAGLERYGMLVREAAKEISHAIGGKAGFYSQP